jgi:anti-sigma B factor antagonist
MANQHDATAVPRPPQSDIKVDETWVDRLAVVSVSGCVDMLTASSLTEAIDSALGKGPSGIVVDLSGVDFLASAGISVLIAASESIGQSGQFGVVADGAATRRPLTLLGLDQIISLYGTLGDALSELVGA